MVSILVVCAAVEWRWCVLLSCPPRCVQPDLHSASVHGTVYCCHVILLSCCHGLVVQGVCVCGVCVVGYSLSAPLPRRGGGRGHRWMVGGMADGGWHSNGRAAVSLASPSVSLVSPSRLLGGLVEWREWCVLWCPRVRIGCACLVLCCPPLVLSIPSSSVLCAVAAM